MFKEVKCFFTRFFAVLYSALLYLPLCRRMLGSNPGQLRIRHWLSDAHAQPTQLGLIHIRLDLIHFSNRQCCGSGSVCFGPPGSGSVIIYTDPVPGMDLDPDPSIIKQNSKKKGRWMRKGFRIRKVKWTPCLSVSWRETMSGLKPINSSSNNFTL